MGFGVRAKVFLLNIDVASLNDEDAACGHGVARIEAKIHKNLLDLTRVGHGAAEGGFR